MQWLVVVVVVVVQVNMVVRALTDEEKESVRKHPSLAHRLPDALGFLVLNHVVNEDFEANPTITMYYWAHRSETEKWIIRGRNVGWNRKVTLNIQDVKLITADKDAKVKHPMDKVMTDKFPELLILDPYPNREAKFEKVVEQVEQATGSNAWYFVADWTKNRKGTVDWTKKGKGSVRWDLWGFSHDGKKIFNLDPCMDSHGYTRQRIISMSSMVEGLYSKSFQKFLKYHNSLKERPRTTTTEERGTSEGTRGASADIRTKDPSDHT